MHRATRLSTCAPAQQRTWWARDATKKTGRDSFPLSRRDAAEGGGVEEGGGERKRRGEIKYHDSVLQWGVGRIEGGGRKIKYHDRVRVWAAVIMPSRIWKLHVNYSARGCSRCRHWSPGVQSPGLIIVITQEVAQKRLVL